MVTMSTSSLIAYGQSEQRGFVPSGRFSRSAPVIPDATDVWDEAYRAGYEDGLSAARAEEAAKFAAERDQWEAIRLAFARFDDESARALQDQLRATVSALCEAMIAPTALDPESLCRRVEQAAGMLRREHDERAVRLNPADIALIEGLLASEITLIPDTSIPRGSLRADTSEGGVEDGPQGWHRALLTAFAEC